MTTSVEPPRAVPVSTTGMAVAVPAAEVAFTVTDRVVPVPVTTIVRLPVVAGGGVGVPPPVLARPLTLNTTRSIGEIVLSLLLCFFPDLCDDIPRLDQLTDIVSHPGFTVGTCHDIYLLTTMGVEGSAKNLTPIQDLADLSSHPARVFRWSSETGRRHLGFCVPPDFLQSQPNHLSGTLPFAALWLFPETISKLATLALVVVDAVAFNVASIPMP